MPSKDFTFEWCKFSPETIRAAVDAADRFLKRPSQATQRKVSHTSGETWIHDTDDEFFADYRKPSATAAAYYRGGIQITFFTERWTPSGQRPSSPVTVSLPERAQVEEVFELLEQGRASSLVTPPPVPPPPSPVVFIGHGGDPQWRDLRDQLHHKHRIDTVAFEGDPHLGEYTASVILGMIRSSNCAILIHTAEDQMADGSWQARQNVVNETGIAADRHGLARTIILRETAPNECQRFSNFDGLTEARFERGNISAAYGDILATLNREFPR